LGAAEVAHRISGVGKASIKSARRTAEEQTEVIVAIDLTGVTLDDVREAIDLIKAHELEFNKANDELLLRYGLLTSRVDGTFYVLPYSPFAEKK
jgi:hypothetical protein